MVDRSLTMRRGTRRGVLAAAVVGFVAAIGLLAVSALGSARAAAPAPRAATATVILRVGGDRSTDPNDISPLPGAEFGLLLNKPGAGHYDVFGYTNENTVATCHSDAQGNCTFTVPLGGAAGEVPAGTHLWVAPVSAPATRTTRAAPDWFSSPALETAPLSPDVAGAAPRQTTDYVFQTPALQPGGDYVSGRDFMLDPGGGGTFTQITDAQRSASGGVWPLSRINPRFPAQCGMNVAIVADLSSSMQPYVTALKGGLDTFVDAMRGTPSRAALFTFSTGSPAVNLATSLPNTSLLPVATSSENDAFKSLYSSWSNGATGTANGFTNWDEALARVGERHDEGEHFNLVVFITDGLPTVYGPNATGVNPSGRTRFREMENAIASANLVKGSDTRLLAVGVGVAGLDATANANLRALSGVVSYDGTNLSDADYLHVNTFADLGEDLRRIFLSDCAPSVSVLKRIVPYTNAAGDTSGAYLPAEPWEFSASVSGTPGEVPAPTVSPERADTDLGTGGVNFKLDQVGLDGADTTITETQQPPYTPFPVNGHNAACINTSTGTDEQLTVTDAGPGSFTVHVPHDGIVSCTVYNQAAAPDAFVVVHKQWVVTSDSGTRTYAEGTQPDGLEARLSLTGPGDEPASHQEWSVPRHEYQPGDHLTVSDATTIDLPGCRLTGATLTGPSRRRDRHLSPRDVSANVGPLVEGRNEYTITNEVDCASHLILRKEVRGGSADPSSWTLQAIGPAGALPGPHGTTGAHGAVSANVPYQLAESVNSSDPALANYAQIDHRADPTLHPQSTGSMECDTVNPGGRTRIGYSFGEDGSIVVPLGETVECVAVNQTAHLSLIKHVLSGGAPPSDFEFTIGPLAPNPSGAPTQTVRGAHAPGSTIQVRPGQRYEITEGPSPAGYQFAYSACTLDGVAHYETTIAVPPLATTTCTVSNSLGAPPHEPVLPPPPKPEGPGHEPRLPVDPARVSIAKHVSVARTRSGHRFTYTISVRTTSLAPARSVRVCDALPAPLRLVRAPGAQVKGRQVCWTVVAMPHGGHRTFVLDVVGHVTRPRTVRNLARVSGPNVHARTATVDVRLRPRRRHPPRFTG